MKQFFCGDVVPDCDHSFEAESEEQILVQVADHARNEHGMSQVPPEVVQQVRSRIHDV